MSNEELVNEILQHVGGKNNVLAATNCQTRLRIDVSDDAAIDVDGLKGIEGVLGVVKDRPNYVEVVVGPGKCRKCADICASMGIPASAAAASSGMTAGGDWEANKATLKAGQSHGKITNTLKTFGEIMVPLIPGVIAAGLCSGFASLLSQVVPNYAESSFWNLIYQFLTLINQAFLTYITAWAGYRAAEKFGATPILGGMLGMITSLGGIDVISQIVGLYDYDNALNAILRSGRGGVLAVVIGVWVLAKVEKAIRAHMPDALDIVCTPLFTLIVVMVPYIFIVMPVTGLISTGLCWIVQQTCMSDILIVRIISGFVAALMFLPLVAMGMHHGLVALYTVQLETLGFVTLYPALAMAGAGQVGAAIAIYQKAKKVGNVRLKDVIMGALPAGVLGVGEPLIYGVTLPMGKPFLTAGLGAGFGGAFVMAMQVASTTWGPSGVVALAIMTAGPSGPAMSIACYAIGLVISYIMGYVITNIAVRPEEVAQA